MLLECFNKENKKKEGNGILIVNKEAWRRVIICRKRSNDGEEIKE